MQRLAIFCALLAVCSALDVARRSSSSSSSTDDDDCIAGFTKFGTQSGQVVGASRPFCYQLTGPEMGYSWTQAYFQCNALGASICSFHQMVLLQNTVAAYTATLTPAESAFWLSNTIEAVAVGAEAGPGLFPMIAFTDTGVDEVGTIPNDLEALGFFCCH